MDIVSSCDVSLDTIAIPLVVVDDEIRVKDFNFAASLFLGSNRDEILNKRAGDALQCINSFYTDDGCSNSPECSNCVIKKSVADCYDGGTIVQKLTKLYVKSENKVTRHTFLITVYPFLEYDYLLALLIIEDAKNVT